MVSAALPPWPLKALRGEVEFSFVKRSLPTCSRRLGKCKKPQGRVNPSSHKVQLHFIILLKFLLVLLGAFLCNYIILCKQFSRDTHKNEGMTLDLTLEVWKDVCKGS